MNLKELLFKILKTKAKDFGFTKEELKSIAATLADNLTLDENATEDEQTAAVTKHVEAYLPLLKTSQSSTQRVLNEWKKNHNGNDDPDEDPQEEPDEDPAPKKSKPKISPSDNKQFKQLADAIAALTDEVKSMKADKTAISRKERLEKELKDTGKYLDDKLEDFSRMVFKDEEDFEDYLQRAIERAKDYKKDEAAKGLGTTPPGNNKTQLPDGTLDDKEIERIAKGIYV
jgi:hypothetical protein